MKRSLTLFLILSLLVSSLPVMAGAQELTELEIFAQYPATYTPEEIETLSMYQDVLDIFAKRGIALKFTYVDATEYNTVLQGRIASKNVPDVFYASGLGERQVIQLRESGLIQCIDDVLQYSDGTAANALSEDGYMSAYRKFFSSDDGKLWFIGDVSNIQYVKRSDGFPHAMGSYAYTMKVRKDWLDELNMAVPTTLDEFYDMLVAFADNDMNKNGVRDERLVIYLDSGNNLTDNGVAGWFGLPNYNFQINHTTNKIELPILQEGFVPYLEFLYKCIDAGVLRIAEDTDKNGNKLGALNKENVISAYFYYVNADKTKPDDAEFIVLDRIVGKEGVEPVMQGNVGDKAFYQFAISSNVDPKIAAIYLDITTSIDASIAWNFGLPGTGTYEVLDTGMYKVAVSTKKADVLANGYTTIASVWNFAFNRNCLYTVYQSYNGEPLIWNSYDEYLSSPYFKSYYADLYPAYVNDMITYANMCENMTVYNMNSDISNFMIAPALESELDVMEMYQTDFSTLYAEICGRLLNRTYDLADLDTYIEMLYDCGMQELLDVYQARYDRTLQ